MALLIPATARAVEDEPAPLPRYEVGSLWPRADATHELVLIDDGMYVFAAPDAEIRLTRTLALASARRGEHFLEIASPPALTWPLEPGDWGVVRSEWRASRPGLTPQARNYQRLVPERLVWHVEDWEEIPRASGPLRTLRIVYRMIGAAFSAPEVVEWEITLWYAPSAGLFVKGADATFGLLQFELAPSADLAALRRQAHVPEPPLPPPPLDFRRRHRETDAACGGLRCPPPAPRGAPE